MKIVLELEIADYVIESEAGEHTAFVRAKLTEEILCYVINELDMNLDSIINTMIQDKEELERGVTV